MSWNLPEIKRQALISYSFQRIEKGHCLVLGEPGVGKTHLMDYLSKHCDERGFVSYFLSADEYTLKRREDLESTLGIKSRFTDVLNYLSSGKSAVFFIDGLDAARDEITQAIFRSLIREVQDGCLYWTVVAGIRTFDAMQSRDLRLLFPKIRSESNNYSHPSVEQNHIFVGPFGDEELNEASQQSSDVKLLLQNPSVEFGRLLRIPRNLEFALKLKDSGLPVESLSAIQSEVQLLNYIWEYYILRGRTRDDKWKIVKDITNNMFDARSLVIDLDQIIGSYENDLSFLISELQSDGILDFARKQSDLIKFSNHSLFDYAVSRHIVPQTSVHEQIEFLKDKQNSIFFRPSIRYFYATQWFHDRDYFWDVLGGTSNADRIAPMEQAMPFVTLVDEARALSDVVKLLDPKIGTEKAIRTTLLSLELFLHESSSESAWWIEFLQQLVETATDGNWLFLVQCIAQFGQEKRFEFIKSKPRYFSTFAQANRRLLKRGWETDKSKATGINALWVVPNICKTYQENIEESRQICQQIIKRLGETSVAVEELYRLSDNISKIIPYDPDVVVEVYTKGFLYNETSDEPRNIGGYVLALQSNLRQDFQMCQYLLSKAFPEFLNLSPIHATKAMIAAVRGHYENNEKRTDDPEILEFSGLRFKPDYSSIWDNGQPYGYHALEILLEFYQWLSSVTDPEIINGVFKQLFKSNELAAVWRRVLMAAQENPQHLMQAVLPMVSNPTVLVAMDTQREAAKAIGAIFHLLNASERAKIESTIEMLPDFTRSFWGQPNNVIEASERLQGQLLNEIPAELIQSPSLRALRDQLDRHGKLKEPVPPFEVGEVRSEPYTTKRWMKDQGIDLDDIHNSRLFKVSDDLNSLMEKLRVASLSELVGKEDEVRTLWSIYSEEKNFCSEYVRANALTTLADFADSTLRHKEFSLQSDFGKIIQEVVLLAAEDNSPEYNPTYHDDFSRPGWSPAPRIEAAQAILKLFAIHHDTDDRIKNLLVKLTSDRVPAVRYQIIRGASLVFTLDKDLFWRIVEPRLSFESTSGVLKALLSSMNFLVQQGELQSKLENHLTAFIQRALSENLDDELAQDAYGMLAELFILYGNETTYSRLIKLLQGDIQNSKYVWEIAKSSFAALLSGISSLYGTRHNRDDIRRRGLQLIVHSLKYVEDQFQALKGKDCSNLVHQIRKLYGIIDLVPDHFYFDADFGSPHQRDTATRLSFDERKRYFQEIATPLFQRVFEICDPSNGGTFPPGAAQKFMELSLLFLPLDFSGTLRLVHQMLKASKAGGYMFDSFSIRSITSLVELLLADYRQNLRDDQVLLTLLSEILDEFVEIGWPEAVQLAFRLDKIFR